MPLIRKEEFSTRIARACDAMQTEDLSCLVMLPGTNFKYFTGLKFARERHRLLMAVITREGGLFLMGPLFEQDKLSSGPVPAQVSTWTDEADQYGIVAALIERECGSTPRVGVELTTNYYHVLHLKSRLTGTIFVDPTASTDMIRAIKSPAEIECLKQACNLTRARMDKVPSQLAKGMTELDLMALYGKGAMIQFGLTTSTPNEVAGKRTLCPGDPIVIDAGDWVEGYRSDLTRTFFFGEPTPEMRAVYKVVNEAELAAIDAAKPGAPQEVIDLAAREVITKAGYGDCFTHRGGHGLGLDFHEIPISVAGNKAPLEPGMVSTAEPGIYLPGKFGIRLEDDLLITESGCELLSVRGPLFLDE